MENIEDGVLVDNRKVVGISGLSEITGSNEM